MGTGFQISISIKSDLKKLYMRKVLYANAGFDHDFLSQDIRKQREKNTVQISQLDIILMDKKMVQKHYLMRKVCLGKECILRNKTF